MRKNIKWIDGKINEVEKKILFFFPKSYIQIIRENNGAYPKLSFFLSKNGGSAIDHFFWDWRAY